MHDNLGPKSECQMWKVFASVGSIWENFYKIFPAYISLHSSPLHVAVFILLFFSGLSEAFLGVIGFIPNQMEEEIGKKWCILWSFEGWRCDAEAGKNTC